LVYPNLCRHRQRFIDLLYHLEHPHIGGGQEKGGHLPVLGAGGVTGVSLECFIQVQEKPFIAKPAKGIVQGQIGPGLLVEQYPKAGAIARLKYLE